MMMTDVRSIVVLIAVMSWHQIARLAPYMLAGVLLAAALGQLEMRRWLAWLGVPLAGIMGLPLHTCGGSAVPVLGELVDMGLSRGMALAFLLSGPATRVTALAALGSLLDRRTLALYVATIVLGATVLGRLLGPIA